MTIKKSLKQTALFSIGTLAMAVASASHGVDFEVGDTKASVYGYAKLDLIYDVDADLGNSIAHENIALDGTDGQEGHTNLHAYQSRIGFSTSTPVAGSTLETKIEGDFYGSGGGELRLRHAYGSWNGILAGQTWTNLYGFVAGTPTIDFTGTFGTGNQARQAQLRYTTGNFAISLEEPDALGGVVVADYDYVDTTTVNGLPVNSIESGDAAQSSLPDVIARYTDTSGPVKYSASGVLRHLEYDAAGQANAPAEYSDDTATGWGITLEAAVDVTEALTLRGGVIHGKGLGDYQNVSPLASPAYVNSDGDLEAIESTGGTFGASLKAGPGAINAAYSTSTVDLDDEAGYADSANDTFETVHLNYIWSPAERISYGIETSWSSRETKGGDDGDAVRIQGMAMYSF